MAAENAPEEQSAGRSKRLLIILIALAVAVLGTGSYIGYNVFFAKQKKGAKRVKAESREGKRHKPGERSETGASKSTLTLEPFLVNLADTPQNRYARVTLKLGLSVPPNVLAEKIAKNDVAIARMRDMILSLLCSKRSDQIMTEEGKRALRQEILEQTNKAMPEGSVEEVFFTDFVVQL